MLKQINALPGSKREPPLEQRNRKIDADQRRPDVGRHVVGTFVVVGVTRGVLRRDTFEKGFEVGANCGRGVFLNDERRRRMSAIEVSRPMRRP